MDQEVLLRYIKGESTPEEIEMVVVWLDEEEENVREYMTLHKLHDIAVMNHGSEMGRNRFLSELKKTSGIWRKIGFEMLKIVAVVVFVLLVDMLWRGAEGDRGMQYQTLYVPAGQRAELVLPDSTKVWLNSHSSLVYPLAFNHERREVQLDGEAFFEVARNVEKEFVVKTRKMNVRVTGTEFNVKAYSETDRLEVDLLSGSVELNENRMGGRTLRMKPGQSAHLTEEGIKVMSIADFDYFRWKEGLICFNNETVEEIMKKLELYYDIKIEVKKKEILGERYSGKFRSKDGIEQVIKLLQLELGFAYTKDNELNLITIK